MRLTSDNHCVGHGDNVQCTTHSCWHLALAMFSIVYYLTLAMPHLAQNSGTDHHLDDQTEVTSSRDRVWTQELWLQSPSS